MFEKKLSIIVVLAALALVGIMSLLFSTKGGIGISPDSTVYISVARSLLGGNGFETYDTAPMTHYPPLYPALLAVTGITGVDLLFSARWLHSLIFGANILLVGFVINSCIHRSTWVWVLGPILVLSFVTMLNIHSMAWSEPTFIFFGMLGVFLLSLYMECGKISFLIASSGVLGLAFLTRYTGVTVIITGILGILLLNKKRGTKKNLADTLLLGAISFLPMILWIIRNKVVASTFTTSNRPFNFHPISLGHVREAVSTFSIWLLPDRVPSIIRGSFLLAVALWTLVSGLIILQKEHKLQIINILISDRKIPYLPGLLTIFLLVYGIFLVFFISFFDPDLPLDGRILSPAYIPALVMFLYIQHHLLVSTKGIRSIYFIVFILCFSLSISFLIRGTIWLMDAHNDGLGYANKAWKSSETLAKIKSLPPEIPIFSNGPDAIYILTGRPASLVPLKINPLARQIDIKYPSQLALMMEQLKRKNGIIVYLHSISWRWYLPEEEELKAKLALRTIYQGTDGTIYGPDMTIPK